MPALSRGILKCQKCGRDKWALVHYGLSDDVEAHEFVTKGNGCSVHTRKNDL